MPETDTKTEYEASTGIDWTTVDGEPRRVEAGEIADDFNADDIEWLVAQGHIAVYVAPEPEVEVAEQAAEEAPGTAEAVAVDAPAASEAAPILPTIPTNPVKKV